jgi:hypothetical protein
LIGSFAPQGPQVLDLPGKFRIAHSGESVFHQEAEDELHRGEAQQAAEQDQEGPTRRCSSIRVHGRSLAAEEGPFQYGARPA